MLTKNSLKVLASASSDVITVDFSIREIVLHVSIAIYIAVVWFICFVCVFQEAIFRQIHGGNFVYAKFVLVHKIFRTQIFAGFAVFSFCV